MSCAFKATPKSPKGVTKRDLLFLPEKFNFFRKKTAAKFLCVKTSSGKVLATSLLYLTVHNWIAGDVIIYLKFALKKLSGLPLPLQITLISAGFS